MKYLMSESYNDERDPSEDREVDDEFVRRFTSLETRRWFEGLGGTEKKRVNASGVIYCESTSPDGETVRKVAFTPVPGS